MGAGTGAAFFDLDKTLIEGSSGVHFAKAAFKSGMIGRRELLGDVWANVRFRLQGSTDEASEEIRDRVLHAIAGTPVKELQRLGHEILAGVLPRIYPEVLRAAYDHQDAGRPAFIVTAASQEMAELMAHVLVLDGGIGTRSEIRDGVYTGRPGGPFTYRSGKAEAIAQVAAERGIDLSASFAYSDSESDLPDARGRRQSGGGQPRLGARPDRPRAGLAHHALRQARAADQARRAVGAVGLVGGVGATSRLASSRAAASPALALTPSGGVSRTPG